MENEIYNSAHCTVVKHDPSSFLIALENSIIFFYFCISKRTKLKEPGVLRLSRESNDGIKKRNKEMKRMDRIYLVAICHFYYIVKKNSNMAFVFKVTYLVSYRSYVMFPILYYQL